MLKFSTTFQSALPSRLSRVRNGCSKLKLPSESKGDSSGMVDCAVGVVDGPADVADGIVDIVAVATDVVIGAVDTVAGAIDKVG